MGAAEISVGDDHAAAARERWSRSDGRGCPSRAPDLSSHVEVEVGAQTRPPSGSRHHTIGRTPAACTTDRPNGTERGRVRHGRAMRRGEPCQRATTDRDHRADGRARTASGNIGPSYATERGVETSDGVMAPVRGAPTVAAIMSEHARRCVGTRRGLVAEDRGVTQLALPRGIPCGPRSRPGDSKPACSAEQWWDGGAVATATRAVRAGRLDRRECRW